MVGDGTRQGDLAAVALLTLPFNELLFVLGREDSDKEHEEGDLLTGAVLKHALGKEAYFSS